VANAEAELHTETKRLTLGNYAFTTSTFFN